MVNHKYVSLCYIPRVRPNSIHDLISKRFVTALMCWELNISLLVIYL